MNPTLPYGGADAVPTHRSATAAVWYLQTAESSDGEVHEQRVEYAPGSPFPPTHLHPRQDEWFEVEHGEMLFEIDGVEHRVAAGSSIQVPRGTPHRARNASAREAAVVRWETRPALRTTEFFTVGARLGDAPGVLVSALLAHRYQDVFRVTGPVGALVPLLAAVARALGRRLPASGPAS